MDDELVPAPGFEGAEAGHIPGMPCLTRLGGAEWLASKGKDSAACVSLLQPHSNGVRV